MRIYRSVFCLFVGTVLATCSPPSEQAGSVPDKGTRDPGLAEYDQSSFDGCWAWFTDREAQADPVYNLVIKQGKIVSVTQLGRHAQSLPQAKSSCQIDPDEGLWGIFIQGQHNARGHYRQVVFRFDENGPLRGLSSRPDSLLGVMIDRNVDPDTYDDFPLPSGRRSGRLVRRSCQ